MVLLTGSSKSTLKSEWLRRLTARGALSPVPSKVGAVYFRWLNSRVFWLFHSFPNFKNHKWKCWEIGGGVLTNHISFFKVS